MDHRAKVIGGGGGEGPPNQHKSPRKAKSSPLFSPSAPLCR